MNFQLPTLNYNIALKSLGWLASVSLEDGLKQAYQWFLDNQDDFRC